MHGVSGPGEALGGVGQIPLDLTTLEQLDHELHGLGLCTLLVALQHPIVLGGK